MAVSGSPDMVVPFGVDFAAKLAYGGVDRGEKLGVGFADSDGGEALEN